ncbi:MAG: thioredoxin [Clostridia bacterium]|nr:thioredoxin [Clostridia bacterium]
MSKVVHLTNSDFEKVVSENSVCLVDFWAPWCGPCKMLGPVIDEIAEERLDIKVCKVNIDEQSELAMKFRVMTIPTVVLFKNGNPEDKIVGALPKQEFLDMIERNMD